MISLLIAVAIIAILAMLYFKKSDNTGKSTMQAGQQGIEQAKQNNSLEKQQHEQIQEQLNNP